MDPARRRSRCRAAAAGRTASAGTPRRPVRSRCRSARGRRGSSRRSPRPSATRRARHGRGRRARRATRRRRSRAGRPSRPASARPARRPSRARPGRSACHARRQNEAAARRRRQACVSSRSCASSGAPCRIRFPADPSASATAATTGTALSAETVSTPSTPWRRATSVTPVDIREVDGLARVRRGEPGRVGVPVDGHDAEAELLRAQDGAALMAPRAHEENRLHVGRDATAPLRCPSRVGAGVEPRQQERDPLGARDLAAVRQGEHRPDRVSTKPARDERLLRAAVLLRAEGVTGHRREGGGPRFASLLHAVVALGRLPAAGPQRSVNFLASPSSRPLGQTVILRSVGAGEAFCAAEPAPQPTTAARAAITIAIRIRGRRVARR